MVCERFQENRVEGFGFRVLSVPLKGTLRVPLRDL